MDTKNEGIGCKFNFEMLDVHQESTRVNRETCSVDGSILALGSSKVPVH